MIEGLGITIAHQMLGQSILAKPFRALADHIGNALVAWQHGITLPKTPPRSEEHTSELQSLMRISYAVFCLKKKTQKHLIQHKHNTHTPTSSFKVTLTQQK